MGLTHILWVNAAPWILTVGASSIDRSFESSIVLGNGKILKVSNRKYIEIPIQPISLQYIHNFLFRALL